MNYTYDVEALSKKKEYIEKVTKVTIYSFNYRYIYWRLQCRQRGSKHILEVLEIRERIDSVVAIDKTKDYLLQY